MTYNILSFDMTLTGVTTLSMGNQPLRQMVGSAPWPFDKSKNVLIFLNKNETNPHWRYLDLVVRNLNN